MRRLTMCRAVVLLLLVSAFGLGPLLGSAQADCLPVELSPDGPDCYRLTLYVDDPPPSFTVCV